MKYIKKKLPNHDGLGKPYGLFLIAFQVFCVCMDLYFCVAGICDRTVSMITGIFYIHKSKQKAIVRLLSDSVCPLFPVRQVGHTRLLSF